MACANPPHLLASSKLWCVDGNEQPFDTSLFGVLNIAFRDLAVLVHVELQKLGLARLRSVHDLVEGAGRKRRYLPGMSQSRESSWDRPSG